MSNGRHPLKWEVATTETNCPNHPSDSFRQIGLKYTDCKPLGHRYLGVTCTTMSSAVQIITQVKARSAIMAVVVYSCSWSYRFISQLEDYWQEYQMYWSPVFFEKWLIDLACCQCTQWTPEKRQGYPRALVLHAFHYFEGWSCEECKIYSIYQQLESSVARSSAASAQAACSWKLRSLNKTWPPAPLLLQRWARRRSGSTL